jgi:serine/threonine protein kinase
MNPDDVESAPEVGMVSSPEQHDIDYTDFEKDEQIGTGGYADVFRVTVDDTPLVLKEPRLEGTVSTDIVDSFVDEAETWAKLDGHDHVVGVVDWGVHRIPWIALEHMDGGSLTERIDTLETAEALWIGICLTRAIQYAHRRGVVHLDLKPANVLFRETSGDTWDVPKIGDWGLSSYLIDHSGTVEGLTPNYAAPEQFDADAYGGADDFTDRYQLAAVIYEALTGERAAPGNGATVLKRVLDEQVTPPTKVDTTLPDAIDLIFERALAKEKSDRYETVVNFRRDLVTVFEEVVDEDSDHTVSEDRRQTALGAGVVEENDETGDGEKTDEATRTPTESIETITGIGPAYADRLDQVGIETINDLAAANTAELAEEIDTSEVRVNHWIERARNSCHNYDTNSGGVSEQERLSEEERIERLLKENGGRMKQNQITEETGWSHAKVSKLISSMEEEGRVDKLRIGRENLISFSE